MFCPRELDDRRGIRCGLIRFLKTSWQFENACLNCTSRSQLSHRNSLGITHLKHRWLEPMPLEEVRKNPSSGRALQSNEEPADRSSEQALATTAKTMDYPLHLLRSEFWDHWPAHDIVRRSTAHHQSNLPKHLQASLVRYSFLVSQCAQNQAELRPKAADPCQKPRVAKPKHAWKNRSALKHTSRVYKVHR